MEPDDLEPRTTPTKPQDLTPPDFTPWSLEDLESYIARLEAEIGRARAAIAAKQRQRSGADALFKKP